MVDAVGSRGRAFLEQAPAPEDDGEVLVLQVDAKGAPTISSCERARRSRPRRVKNGKEPPASSTTAPARASACETQARRQVQDANMAVVGVIYTLRRDGRAPGSTLRGLLI
jgi:hypothetical protein